MEPAMETPLALWGGVECTVNRVRGRFFNQLARSGHWEREDDLNRFAELGLRTLRFPLLWETAAAHAGAEPDWSWPDRRLALLRTLGISPVAGLLHHGSGPLGTSLLDPGFPEKFAAYAGTVAHRYPWIDAYTPINEPLTTARFSALYGHWYPHKKDDASFARALWAQCRGVVLAMRAIREVAPHAILVQTEDLGKTYSTPELRYQAEFENQRRWITSDLLCGRVDHDHPMASYLKLSGISDSALELFVREPCPPDLIGVNYYVTSERYLDGNVFAHPAETRGGNGRHSYADIAAVRSPMRNAVGLENLLMEVRSRYDRPIAVTEAHLGCTGDEQLRWFMEVWDAACAARNRGADIRAVTVWSLLGSFDWDSLVTHDAGHYEPGVFDVSRGDRRPTILAEMVRSLAVGQDFNHPLLSCPGWWRAERSADLRCA